MSTLAGKVALITGAGRGIGRATALAFAEAGASLVLNDVGCAPDGTGSDPAVLAEVVREVSALGAGVVGVNGSVVDAATTLTMVERAVQEFGHVDAAVACAGILRDKSLSNASVEDLDAIWDVQVKGTFLLFQAASAVMKRQTSGTLIATTSTAGLLGNYGQSAYSAASAAVHGLVRTASIELQRRGIRANAVAPLAKTRLTEHLPMFEHVETMGPEHVAPLYTFLASDSSSGLTGVTLTVAGGRVSLLRLTETASEFKEGDRGVWTPDELALHFTQTRRT
jgi:NAD(P)-dependent dehydrogenase (short-subunit alcohol dehydrogenase family)